MNPEPSSMNMQKKVHVIACYFLKYLAKHVHFLVLSFFFSTPTFAQLSGSISFASDYVYRGSSLSHHTPVAQLNLNIDDPRGLFAGGFASKPMQNSTEPTGSHAIIYAGIAKRLASELTWEAGIKHATYTNTPNWSYNELFYGLSSEKLNLRLHYSPSYLGSKKDSKYIELNSDLPLNETWSLTLHGGALFLQNQHSRIDTRISVKADFAPWIIQLAWNKNHQKTAKKYYENKKTDTIVATLSYTF